MIGNFLKIFLISLLGAFFSAAPTPPESAEWKPLGPYLPFEKSIRPTGVGWVDAIWSDPENRDHILIGARSGGLWESDDRGKTWKCLTERIPVFGVFDIDVNPKDPQDILIATGLTGGGYHKFQHHTKGIFRSRDGGSSWKLTNSPRELTIVSELERDPFRPKHLYGIYAKHESKWTRSGSQFSGNFIVESWDGGNTWTRQKMEFLKKGEARELKFSPKHKDQLHLVGKGTYMKSYDGGQTWEDRWPDLMELDSLQRGTEKELSQNHILTIDLQIYSDKETVFIYAHDSKRSNRLEGNKFYKFKETEADVKIPYTPYFPVSSPGRVGRVIFKASPWNENQFFYGKTNLVILFWDPLNNKADRERSIKTAGKVHDDLRELVMIDSNEILIGTDGGFSVSENGGRSWSYRMGDPELGRPIDNSEFYDFDATSYQGKPFLIGGTQDNSSYMYHDGQWIQHGAGDGGVSKIIEVNDSSIFFTLNTNYYTRLVRMKNWPKYRSSPNFVFASALYDKVVFPADQNGTAFVIGKVPEKECQYPSKSQGKGQRNMIHRFTGYKNYFDTKCFSGENFQALKGYPDPIQKAFDDGRPLAWPYNNITALGTIPGNTEHLVFATADWGGTNFRLFRTENGGAFWSDLSGNLPAKVGKDQAHISDIQIDQNNPRRMWICLSHFLEGQKVFESRDNGKSWINISKGLEEGNVPCNALEYDPKNQFLYLGNDNGVYYLPTQGLTQGWSRLYRKLPYVRVTELKLVEEDQTLYAATWGRGIWECPVMQKRTKKDSNRDSSINPGEGR